MLNKKDKKQLKEIMEKVEKLEKRLEENREYFDTFNFKVHEFFQDKDGNFEIIKQLLKNKDISDDINFYLEMMWENFKEDFEYMKQYENKFDWIEYENYCGSSYVLKDNQLDYNIEEREFYFSDGYGLNEFLEALCYGDTSYYGNIEIFKTLKAIRKNSKYTNLKNLLSYINETYIDNVLFDNVLTDIGRINEIINQTIKCYKYIEHMKNLVTSRDFLTFTLLNTSKENFNFKNLDGMVLPLETLDSELFDNCIIKRAGENIKLYYSFYKQPVLFKVQKYTIQK